MSSGEHHAPEDAYQHLQAIHEEPTSFWRKYVFSIDHKVIAKQFLWAGFIFLAIGGFEAMLIRWQWAYPGEAVPVVLFGCYSVARIPFCGLVECSGC